MGFGFLLIGYMFAFLISSAGLGPWLFAGMAIGSIFMFFGLKELRKYDPVFIYAHIGNILLFVCSLMIAVYWALSSFSNLGANYLSTLSTIINYIKLFVCIFFEIAMLYGVADLSKRVDYPDTRKKAYTNMAYVVILNVLQLAILILVAFGIDVSPAFITILVIARTLYTAINSYLLFKCYAMICPVGQEDMPYKKSKFAFINKFREIRDAKDEKAIEEMKNYYEDKLKKRNSKRNSKHSKKKKKK